MIKVVHVTAGEQSTGKTALGRLLHEAMPSFGAVSYMLTAGHDAASEGYNSQLLFSQDSQDSPVLTEGAKGRIAEADVLHLHTTQDQVCTAVLNYLKALPHQPFVIWSQPDGAAITGGCYYTADCADWQTGCQQCQLRRTDAKAQQQVRERLAAKAGFFADKLLTIGTSSVWQGNQLAASMLKDKARFLLPTLVDHHSFYPGTDQQQQRIELGLPVDSFIIACEFAGQQPFNELSLAVRPFIDNLNPVVILMLHGDTTAAIRSLKSPSAAMLGSFYRAADIYIDLRETGFYQEVREAAACGCPALILRRGEAAEVVDSGRTGIIIDKLEGKAIFEALKPLIENSELRQQYMAGCRAAAARTSNAAAVQEYIRLYQAALVNRNKTVLSLEEAAGLLLTHEPLAAAAAELKRQLEKLPEQEIARRNAVTDHYCLACLSQKNVLTDREHLWSVVKLWIDTRSNADLKTSAADDPDGIYLQLLLKLRQSLVSWFRRFGLEDFQAVQGEYINAFAKLWRDVFLNPSSYFNTCGLVNEPEPDFSAYKKDNAYPYMLLHSMYVPYDDSGLNWNVKNIVSTPMMRIMMYFFAVLLVQQPFYDDTKQQQERVLSYIREFCRALTEQLDSFAKGDCIFLLQVFMMAAWRVSYSEYNTAEAALAYGDFLQAVNRKFRPEFAVPIKPRRRKKHDKLRVGYVSLRFYHSAVSMYMGNRIFQRNRDLFDVTCISLASNKDAMLERFRREADKFVDFNEIIKDADDKYAAMAAFIKAQKFDVLIYPDIGMDEIGLQLGAMHLAPVQLCMMGHCMTSGLSSIDAYISGDHEPADAQAHYVEKLVRLPVMGSCQLPPAATDFKLTRRDIGVPEDAVMLLSTANGIKHGVERDALLVQILQRVKNAYIVLKPFLSNKMSDRYFVERMQKLAADCGAAGRIIVLNTFKQAGDLKALFELADMQLDTYPVGGWTTNLEAFYYHLPTVTQEGSTARSRWGAAMLRAMGITQGIAANEQEYVEWAVKMAKNAGLRKQLRRQLEEQVLPVLFNPVNGQAEFEAFLQQAALKKGR